MTLHPQTRELIRRLHVAGIRAELRGDRIVFTGGSHGEHSIAAEHEISPPERVVAHWSGYLEVNGINPATTPGSAIHYNGNGHKPNARIYVLTRRGALGALYSKTIYRTGKVGRESIYRRVDGNPIGWPT